MGEPSLLAHTLLLGAAQAWPGGAQASPLDRHFFRTSVKLKADLTLGLTCPWPCHAAPSHAQLAHPLPAAGSPASLLEQAPTNSPGLPGSWPQGRTWCWAAVDSRGQLWQRAGLAAGDSLWDMPHASPSLPHLNKYLLSTAVCQSGIKGQGSALLPLGLTQLGHWGCFAWEQFLPPPPQENGVHRPGAHLLGAPSALGQLAGAARREPAGCCAWSPAAASLGAREVPICFGRQCPVRCCPRSVTCAPALE